MIFAAQSRKKRELFFLNHRENKREKRRPRLEIDVYYSMKLCCDNIKSIWVLPPTHVRYIKSLAFSSLLLLLLGGGKIFWIDGNVLREIALNLLLVILRAGKYIVVAAAEFVVIIALI